MSLDLYDVKRQTITSDADGLPSTAVAVVETRYTEIQSLRWYEAAGVEIELGGQRFTPTFRGWIEEEALVTAGDVMTKDSGTVDLLVLRVHVYESHKEIDLRETQGD
jgi:hypothetical protein